MDKSTIIAKLNEIQRHEWTGVAQYMQYSFLVRGHWREVFADKFHDSAKESLGHGKQIGDKIAALGGVPPLERGEVQQTIDLDQMLKASLDFEQKAVSLYSEAIKMAEEWGNRPLVVLLEDILLEEQEGVDDLTKIMGNFDAAPARSTSKAG